MTVELSAEHLAFREIGEQFVAAEMPKDWAREDEYPLELWDKFTAGGFHGLGTAEEDGGAGGDVLMQVIAARAGANARRPRLALGDQFFCGRKTMTRHGTEEQKRRFLPDIGGGRLRAAISPTEPGRGTDVLGAMRTFGDMGCNTIAERLGPPRSF